MFSQEQNGYNKQEVDSFIARLKASYESKLMEEKLKALDSEKRMLDMKNMSVEIENKEKNILTALNVLEKAKIFQEQGFQNLYKLIMDKLEILVDQLKAGFPQLSANKNFQSLMSEFSNMVHAYKISLDKPTDINSPVNSSNDSMRMLLNKMQEYKKVQDVPKEVHISTNKPASQPTFNASQDDFSESGFSFEEALNPTEDLAEIMKAFDFYNE